MKVDDFQLEAARIRFKDRARKRALNERLIKEKRFLEVDTPERIGKFLSRRQFSATDIEQYIRTAEPGIRPARELIGGRAEPYALERAIGTNDLCGIAFLELGLQVSRSVGRIWGSIAAGSPRWYGTGFMVSPHLLITNNHVLPDAATARISKVEFNYQLSPDGSLLPTDVFDLDANLFFVTDVHLDYTIVAVREVNSKGTRLESFGWNSLIEAEGKAIISQYLNVIQHPEAEPKKVGLRENQLVDVLDDFLHYKTDTAPGSSGAPVYNDLWEVVALHHSGVEMKDGNGRVLAIGGGLWDPSMGEDRVWWEANEGVRISRICAHVRGSSASAEQDRLIQEMLTAPPPEAMTRSVPASDIPSTAPFAGSVSVDREGAATWTVPISISIRVGERGGRPVVSQSPVPGSSDVTAPPGVPGAPRKAEPTDYASIVEAARADFSHRSDVLGVRLGYKFKDGWITKDRALVITVRSKLSMGSLKEMSVEPLPETYRGLRVDVSTPTPEQIVRAIRGAAVAKEAFASPQLLREEITYTPPAGAVLATVTDRMRVVAHLSPDAGWPVLSAFLQGVKNRLVVGMYDFGAPHIVDAVEAVGRKGSFTSMTLVIQPGESIGGGTKADDLKDAEVAKRLEDSLGDKFKIAWVKIGSQNGWVSSSYHIKVAVRDEEALWLSSGNWQSSNQPPADPLHEVPMQRTWLERYNREWHIVLEHKGLAKTFQQFLMNDFDHNTDGDADERFELPDLLVPEVMGGPSPLEVACHFKYFPPFEETRDFTVTPMLTPDNYHEGVLELINSAKSEILLQNQTFNAPKDNQEKLRELIDAVKAKQEEGVTVKVIFRVLFASKAREELELLKDYGFDTDCIRLQKNCHTKGIVVDRKRVLIGSQNWSNDGVSVNRDASLLFDDAPLAAYFAAAFEHDWDNLARSNIGSESMPVQWATPNEATPEGMIRLDAKDYMEMQ